jgi:colanic acid/amylovoran biosynthesis glycosyltransferase
LMVFKETVLPPSETFILAQMRLLKRYSPILVGLEPARKSLEKPSIPLLLSERTGPLADLRSKLYRRIAWAPIFHSRVRALGANLIHAHFASGGKALVPLKRRLGIPMIVTLHGGTDVPVDAANHGTYRRVAEEADLIICVSGFIRERALKAGYPAEKLRVHYIGIDLSFFQAPQLSTNSSNILFVGRLVEKKGCEDLLRAMKTVQAKCKEARLDVIGDGPLRSNLEALSRELNINVRFLGLQPADSVRSHLADSRVFCMPSFSTADGDTEGLPMVIVEAQAMGVPVVSTFHAGGPEAVLHERTGLLCPERDIEALADALVRVLREDRLHASFREKGLKNVAERFDLAKQTAKLEELYDFARTFKNSHSSARENPRDLASVYQPNQ